MGNANTETKRRGGCLGAILFIGAGKLLGLALGAAAALVWLNQQPTMYRATGKLLAAPRIATPPGGEIYSDAGDRFFATQTEILKGALLNQRVAARLAQFRDAKGQLPRHELRAPVPKESAIFTVTVDSPNGEFAKAYLGALFDEFLKFKGELKTFTQNAVLERYSRLIGEQKEELRRAEDDLFQFKLQNPLVSEEKLDALHRAAIEASVALASRRADADAVPPGATQPRAKALADETAAAERRLKTLANDVLQTQEKLEHLRRLEAGVALYSKARDDLFRGLSDITTGVDLAPDSILEHEPAALGPSPVSPHRTRALLIGMLAGLAAGGVLSSGATLAWRMRKPR